MAVKTKIGPYSFDNCIMNASGVHCSTAQDLIDLDQSLAASVVSKTATLNPRSGNEVPRIHAWGPHTINSSGLPNLGVDFYIQQLEALEEEHPDKTYFISITEMSEDKICHIIDRVQASSLSAIIELNLSCPNIIGKAQVGYDYEACRRLLDRVFASVDQELGLKLPPYFDLNHFDQMAKILNHYPLRYVNTMNSIGNALVVQDLSVTIKAKNGFGGLGGPMVKATALANVHAFYQRLDESISIIGTGGVSRGRDVFEHILCGASMVQLASSLWSEGPGIFNRLTQELEDEMARYGFSTLEDFKGQLNYL